MMREAEPSRGAFAARRVTRWLSMTAMALFVAGTMTGCLGCGGPNQEVETDPVPTDEQFDELDVTPVDEPPDFGDGTPLDGSGSGGTDLDAPREPLPTIRDVFFDYDSDVIDAEGRAALEANARILRDRDDLVVLIEGHCDERGTAQYNMALGWRRAESVRDYLVRLRVPANRLRTVSYGKEQPFVTGVGEDVWSQNRRAHFDLSYQE